MKPPAREALTIFWDGEETAGFTVYGLRARGANCVEDRPLSRLLGDVAVKPSTLRGEQWEVCVWDVRVDGWPRAAQFSATVQQALCSLVDGGFVVAWIGLEGHFADPPWLFAPEAMSGGVLAACSEGTGFISSLDLDAPLQALLDTDLVALRAASDELASAE